MKLQVLNEALKSVSANCIAKRHYKEGIMSVYDSNNLIAIVLLNPNLHITEKTEFTSEANKYDVEQKLALSNALFDYVSTYEPEKVMKVVTEEGASVYISDSPDATTTLNVNNALILEDTAGYYTLNRLTRGIFSPVLLEEELNKNRS